VRRPRPHRHRHPTAPIRGGMTVSVAPLLVAVFELFCHGDSIVAALVVCTLVMLRCYGGATHRRAIEIPLVGGCRLARRRDGERDVVPGRDSLALRLLRDQRAAGVKASGCVIARIRDVNIAECPPQLRSEGKARGGARAIGAAAGSARPARVLTAPEDAISRSV